jgi:MFS family permease
MAGAAEIPVQAKPTMLSLLMQPNFRRLWLAQAVSWSGDHFTFLALMIVINQATRSAGAIALLMLVMTIPRMVLGMIAGVFVDRWDRQRLMVTSDLLRGVLSLALIWVARSQHIGLIYPLALVISSVGVFFVPARSAVMKTILKENELLPANILMQTTFTVTLVIGPALAGVLIGKFGTTPAFAFDALTFFISSALVATMIIARFVRANGHVSSRSAFWAEFTEGLDFVRASRMITAMLLVLTVVSMATGAINALFVPFLMNVLHVGATELGLGDSAQGLGMIAGGMLTAAVAARLRANQILGGSLLLAGILIVAIGLAPTYYVVLVLLFAVGLVVMPLEATIPAVMQKIVPLDKIGRVGGTMNTGQSVATVAAMGGAGIAADAVGARLVFVVAGAICAVGAFLALSLLRGE